MVYICECEKYICEYNIQKSKLKLRVMCRGGSHGGQGYPVAGQI